METKIIDVDQLKTDEKQKKEFETAVSMIQSGGLVAFPTETVYGLGADALNKDASAKIYQAKGRPSDNPLIVHIGSMDAVNELAVNVPDNARKLMQAFWPGPLTVILNKSEVVPKETTGGLMTVAIRMPDHYVARELILQSGKYIAAPSANLSGRPSPTIAKHVIDDLSGRVDAILKSDDVSIGIESTIVDFTGEKPMILRPGYYTKNMIESVIGEVLMDPALETVSGDVKPKAPGMKYRHYAPKGDLIIVEGKDQEVIDAINRFVEEKEREGSKVAVIAQGDHVSKYRCDHILDAGDMNDDITVSRSLYRVLRECDDLAVDYIYSESFDDGEHGYAIMNRLLKAAGHHVMNLRGEK